MGRIVQILNILVNINSFINAYSECTLLVQFCIVHHAIIKTQLISKIRLFLTQIVIMMLFETKLNSSVKFKTNWIKQLNSSSPLWDIKIHNKVQNALLILFFKLNMQN